MKKIIRIFSIFSFVIAFAGCQQVTLETTQNVTLLEEHPVTQIELAGPVSKANAEVSGMAWCDEHLILLPQFPDQFKEDGTGSVFSIAKSLVSEYFKFRDTDSYRT